MNDLLTAKEANVLYGQQPGCKPYCKAQSLIELMQRRGFTIHKAHNVHAVNREDVIAVAQTRVEENVWKLQRNQAKPIAAESNGLATLRAMASRYGVAAKG